MSTQNEATQAPAIAGDNQQPSPAAAPLVPPTTSGSEPLKNPWDVLTIEKNRSLFLGILDVLEREFPDDLRSVKSGDDGTLVLPQCPHLIVDSNGWNVQAMQILSEFAKANGNRHFLQTLARILCGLTHEIVMKGGLVVHLLDDEQDSEDESLNREVYALPSARIEAQGIASEPSAPEAEPVQP